MSKIERKWTWMMSYCKKLGIAPANKYNWARAGRAWSEANSEEIAKCAECHETELKQNMLQGKCNECIQIKYRFSS